MKIFERQNLNLMKPSFKLAVFLMIYCLLRSFLIIFKREHFFDQSINFLKLTCKFGNFVCTFFNVL